MQIIEHIHIARLQRTDCRTRNQAEMDLLSGMLVHRDEKSSIEAFQSIFLEVAEETEKATRKVVITFISKFIDKRRIEDSDEVTMAFRCIGMHPVNRSFSSDPTFV